MSSDLSQCAEGQTSLEKQSGSNGMRSVTFFYDIKTFEFGWKEDVAPREFAAQLQRAVRHGIDASSRDRIAMYEEPEQGECDQKLVVRPRDILAGSVSRVRLILANAVPRISATPTTLAPPVPVRVGGGLQQARSKKGGGGSQIQFIHMMSMNKNPLPKLPEGTELTLEEVARHRTHSDCWTIFRGFVYDVSMYVDYHPGGRNEIMKGAGTDCTNEFLKAHPWVSADGLIGRLCLGRLKKSIPPALRLPPPTPEMISPRFGTVDRADDTEQASQLMQDIACIKSVDELVCAASEQVTSHS